MKKKKPQQTIKEKVEALQKQIEDIYYQFAPLPSWQEKEILDIRAGYEAEAEYYCGILVRQGLNAKETEEITEQKCQDACEELKLKYMQYELDYLMTLK